ncbi:hypothetical protein S7711_09142 [Stachybotrys chartarum IBT 7711]|uniref:Uncharacterized protein n=1 Tax=Stachybotrys chartarum (strain CBS 109288 / IBT 7711) TaxID=1280523 RepID=A0A084AHN1_STACB|nr:hypothetical protein S7711_09142 [Stachybotrys chartarum IBT 7711]KFA46728.1 hypothetical protein S40293_07795 [Stachybotrys chartarum IBT 40293]KFA72396.1 hypothetical protein S40288_09538 [Stachybotrys chartarum IBT 40288]
MDLDIEMDDAIDVGHDMPAVDLPRGDDILQTDDLEEPGEVADDEPKANSGHGLDDDSTSIVPNKIHIRGVDTLHTDDIKNYVKAHYGHVDRVEWIDDTSANLVFGSELTARDALTALSTIEVADATALAIGETLPAKALDGRPEISLHVRFAVGADRKQAGAALRSRYYLLHPEHDPEEKRRRQQDSRSRYRDRDGDHRRGEGRRRRRDSDEQVERFEASMYDDAPRASRDRRGSEGDRPARSYADENRGKELFGSRSAARDRSASPGRERGGLQSDDLFASSSRNRTKARSIKGQLSENTSSRELFPTKSSRSGRSSQLDQLEEAIGSARLRDEDMPKVVVAAPRAAGGFSIKGLASQRVGDGDDPGFSIKGAASAKELFPDKLGGSNTGKELFDGGRSRRRQRAEDLFA